MMGDPIATRTIPEHLRRDERLRAMCLSGALCYDEYLAEIAEAGFNHIEVRARKPYRTLCREMYGLDSDLVLDALDTVSHKGAVSNGEVEIFTGRRAIYTVPLASITVFNHTLHHYQRAQVSDFHTASSNRADTVYVIGGLYGNLDALHEILRMQEAEIAAPTDAGCGCNYPDYVNADYVARSNAMTCRDAARHTQEAIQREYTGLSLLSSKTGWTPSY